MASGSISRRGVLKGGGALAFAGLSVAALGLPFFDVDGAQQDPRTCRAGDESESDPRLNVSNWPGYIDPRRFEGNTRDLFEQETGITVRYTDDVNDNAEFYAKVRSQLGSCEAIDRDIMVLTDWMAARMIGLGWTQPLAKDKVPNLHNNLIKPLRGVQWDPDLEFHAPWQSGLTGIAYNAAETSEVGSFQDLVTRPDLKGRITLLSEMRDTMAFMLRLEGADPDDFTQDQWDNAIDNISKVVDSGQVRAFTGNDYIQDLSNGNVLACEAWSGDVIQAQFDNPDIRFVVPEEGVVAVERQHDGAQPGDSSGERRGLDQLLLRPGQRCSAGRVGQLHLSRRRRSRGDGEDRPVVGRQHADLPRREDAREHVRLHAAR